MKRVVLESPFSGDVELNVRYARACVRDCLKRGEAPIASHLLFTQKGILDDAKPEERKLGMEAGFAWNKMAELVVVYTDLGYSTGMKEGVKLALTSGIKVDHRHLPKEELARIRQEAEDAKKYTATTCEGQTIC